MRESRTERPGCRFRCVMWTPRGRVLDAALLDALRRRQDLELVIAESVYTAVGSVLRVARERESGLTPVLLLVEPRLLTGAAEAVAAVRSAAGDDQDQGAGEKGGGRRVAVWVYERRSRAYVRALRAGEPAAWSAAAATQREPKPTGGRPAAPIASRLIEASSWNGRPRLRLAIDAPMEARGEEAAAGSHGGLKGASENALRDASCSVPEREVGQARVTGMTLTDEELSMLLAKGPERGQDSR